MTAWAIDAQKLVKKFPQRAPANGEKSAATGQKKPSGLLSRLFRKPERKEMFTAVDGVDLQIAQGEIFGLLGPNGAGKSTTIRMLCTLLEPTGGTAHVNGFDILRQPTQVRQSLGTVLAGERSIYWKLTGRENLEYFAALYHLPPAVARQRINELLERMEISDRANELVEKYSTGMRQRIALSKALLARPPILLLDEPTLGLDPQAARRVRELIAELKAEGHTILLTTHYMEEADQLSDRIGIIDQGKIIALDTPAGLKQRIDQHEIVHMEVSGWNTALNTLLEALPNTSNLIVKNMGSDSLYEISLQTANSRIILPGLIQTINQNGTHLVNLNIVRPTLEDVFIHLTGKALRD
jgi:ABC-2 type transport system ATP-binding protein